MVNLPIKYRVIRMIVVSTVISAAVSAAIGAGLVDVDKLHWTFMLGTIGGVAGFILSLGGVAVILRPTGKRVDIVYSCMFVVAILIALVGAAILEGDVHLLFEKKYIVMFGGALALGVLMYLKARLD